MIELKSKVGSRGQIVIPKPLRDILHINPGERVLFRLENNEIYLRKEEGTSVLKRMLERFREKRPEPGEMDWDILYYSQLVE